MIELKVEGLDQLQAKLNELKPKIAKRAMNKALRAGGDVFKQAIEERAPERPDLPSGNALPPGALRHDISVKTIPNQDGTSSIIAIGPGKYTTRQARWVEFGHRQVRGGYSKVFKNGKTRGPGKGVGNVPPHPFMRPAFDEAQQAATDAIAKSLREQVEEN